MPRWLIVISALLLGWSGEAVAQTWPSKPIRAIVAFAAGSATDVIPRVVFEPLSAQLGQPIVVENRGGAGTTIGAAMVAKAEPDGYTLLATSSAHTLVPTVYPNASYDTAADFAAGWSRSEAAQTCWWSRHRRASRRRRIWSPQPRRGPAPSISPPPAWGARPI